MLLTIGEIFQPVHGNFTAARCVDSSVRRRATVCSGQCHDWAIPPRVAARIRIGTWPGGGSHFQHGQKGVWACGCVGAWMRVVPACAMHPVYAVVVGSSVGAFVSTNPNRQEELGNIDAGVCCSCLWSCLRFQPTGKPLLSGSMRQPQGKICNTGHETTIFRRESQPIDRQCPQVLQHRKIVCNCKDVS
jgi:hypothetical protein